MKSALSRLLSSRSGPASENAQPSAPSLKCEPQRRTEEACEQCGSADPEKCVPATGLEAICGHANLVVNVDYIRGPPGRRRQGHHAYCRLRVTGLTLRYSLHAHPPLARSGCVKRSDF